MIVAYLSTGSNQGDRSANLRKAETLLSEKTEIEVLQSSQVHETPPWPAGNKQPHFLNQILKIQTTLSALDLLSVCQKIEKKIGRTPSRKWGPREIDIDILLYGNQVESTPELTLPHPHMHEREFVLKPLVEVEPELKDPIHGKLYSDFLKNLQNGPE